MDGLCFNCGSHLPAGSPSCPMCGALGNVQPPKPPEWGQLPEAATLDLGSVLEELGSETLTFGR